MNANPDQILSDLNKHALEFNFPVLDNAYIEFAAARLSAFQGETDWLVCFEVLGFSTRELEFVDDIYAYGSCVDREGFVGERIPLKSDEALPLFDQNTNQCIADWSHFAIRLDEEAMSFSPTLQEYGEAGIILDRPPGPGSLSEIELLRFLLHRLGEERLFMKDQILLSYFPRCKNLSKFVQTTQ